MCPLPSLPHSLIVELNALFCPVYYPAEDKILLEQCDKPSLFQAGPRPALSAARALGARPPQLQARCWRGLLLPLLLLGTSPSVSTLAFCGHQKPAGDHLQLGFPLQDGARALGGWMLAALWAAAGYKHACPTRAHNRHLISFERAAPLGCRLGSISTSRSRP